MPAFTNRQKNCHHARWLAMDLAKSVKYNAPTSLLSHTPIYMAFRGFICYCQDDYLAIFYGHKYCFLFFPTKAELLPKSQVWRYIHHIASYVSNETNWHPYDVSMNIIQHTHHPRIHTDCSTWEVSPVPSSVSCYYPEKPACILTITCCLYWFLV